MAEISKDTSLQGDAFHMADHSGHHLHGLLCTASGTGRNRRSQKKTDMSNGPTHYHK